MEEELERVVKAVPFLRFPASVYNSHTLDMELKKSRESQYKLMFEPRLPCLSLERKVLSFVALPACRSGRGQRAYADVQDLRTCLYNKGI